MLDFYICYGNITAGLRMRVAKRPYVAPRLVRAGSFEELTRTVQSWENLIMFGMNGKAAGMSATS